MTIGHYIVLLHGIHCIHCVDCVCLCCDVCLASGIEFGNNERMD